MDTNPRNFKGTLAPKKDAITATELAISQVSFASKVLTDVKNRYCQTELEGLA